MRAVLSWARGAGPALMGPSLMRTYVSSILITQKPLIAHNTSELKPTDVLHPNVPVHLHPDTASKLK